MKTLLRGGTLHVGDGSAPFEGDILLDGGRIAKIAPHIEAEGAGLVDASGCHIVPGFIDPQNPIGAQDLTYSVNDTDETSSPLTPEADMAYSVDSNEMAMEELYRVGVTTVGSTPGNSNVIGGLMAVTHTFGANSAKLILKKQAAMKGSVCHAVKETYAERNVLKTRMGMFSLLKKQLHDPHPNMKQVLSGELPFIVWAENASEIDALLETLSPYPDIRLTIAGAYDAPIRAEKIAARGAGIIFGEQVYCSKNVYFEHDLAALRGIPLSYTISGQSGPSGRVKYLWNAARFHAAGYGAEEVLAMMTSTPAKMLGVEKETGKLQEGLLADLSVWSEHPVAKYSARCLCTFVGGEIAYKEGN